MQGKFEKYRETPGGDPGTYRGRPSGNRGDKLGSVYKVRERYGQAGSVVDTLTGSLVVDL